MPHLTLPPQAENGTIYCGSKSFLTCRHAKTAENAYAGQAGAYIVTDPEEDALNLPSGYGVYDIPLILSAKQYNDDGTLFSLENEDNSLWGDIIQVNDQPWPFLNVEPRKYRFRLLNAAVSRSFALYFVATANVNAPLPFKVIASDTGLLEKPVQVSNVVSPDQSPLQLNRRDDSRNELAGTQNPL